MSLRDWTKQSGAFKISEVALTQGNLLTGNDSTFDTGIGTWSGTRATASHNATDKTLLMTVTSANSAPISATRANTLPAVSGGRYRIKFRAKSDNISGVKFLYMGSLSVTTTDANTVSVSNPNITSSWQDYEFMFTHNGTTTLYIGFTSTNVNVADTWELDDIVIQEITGLDTVINGTKYLECTTAGNLYIPLTNMSVGTYEFDINMSNVGLFSNLYILDSPTLSSAVGYGFSAGYRNRIMRYAGSDTMIYYTVPGVNLVNTWYSLKITRTVTGVITMYIRGGAYGNNWTLVSATGGIGSNPVTDTNYFNAKIALFTLRAGDKIANIKFYDGVRQ